MPEKIISGRDRAISLVKMAFPSEDGLLFHSRVGEPSPPATVSDVLNAIGLAQVHDVGTPKQRTDAFGRVINSGAYASSPAWTALKAVGGGVLGHFVTGLVTNNPIAKGIGAGIGINLGLGRGI